MESLGCPEHCSGTAAYTREIQQAMKGRNTITTGVAHLVWYKLYEALKGRNTHVDIEAYCNLKRCYILNKQFSYSVGVYALAQRRRKEEKVFLLRFLRFINIYNKLQINQLNLKP